MVTKGKRIEGFGGEKGGRLRERRGIDNMYMRRGAPLGHKRCMGGEKGHDLSSACKFSEGQMQTGHGRVVMFSIALVLEMVERHGKGDCQFQDLIGPTFRIGYPGRSNRSGGGREWRIRRTKSGKGNAEGQTRGGGLCSAILLGGSLPR